jgi:hypothetical protein
MFRLLSRFLRTLFQFSICAAGEAAKFGRSGVEPFGVVGAARLEGGEPTAEASGGSLAIASAISSTFIWRSIAPTLHPCPPRAPPQGFCLEAFWSLIRIPLI